VKKSRLALAALMAVFSIALQSAWADAGVAWCSEDPILTFSNGTQLQLLVRYDGAYSPVVEGPIAWSVQVPVNAGRISVTVPVNASHQEYVALSYTGGQWGGGNNDLQIHATATVSGAYTFPIVLSVYGDTSTSPKTGSSNKALTIAAHTHAGSFTAYEGVTSGTVYTFTGTGSVTLP
jgi:hypothetical protein